MSKQRTTKILLAGEGGQGIQTLAKIFSEALFSAGYYVSILPQFGPEQRGTPSVVFLIVSDKKVYYPKFDTADLVVVLRKRAVKQVNQYIGDDTMVIFDSSTTPRSLFSRSSRNIFALPATKIAKEQFSLPTMNIIVLGILCNSYFHLDTPEVWRAVENQLAKKFSQRSELRELNRKALKFGYNLNLETKKYSRPEFDTKENIVVEKGDGKTAVIIPKFCKGCGICVLKCPVKAIKFGEVLGVFGTPTPEVNLGKCILCGNCRRFCPDSAIRVKKI